MINNLELEVRDYECDIQGIVNNARYIHYLEHARHKALDNLDVDFVKLHNEGKDLVVTELNMKYHASLKPRDKFRVETNLIAKGKLRLHFEQKIYRDDELIISALTIGVCVSRLKNRVLPLTDFLACLPNDCID
jgi:acyl-CoA thioester hydrolase